MFNTNEHYNNDVHRAVSEDVRGRYDDTSSDVRANARTRDISGLRPHHRAANAADDTLPLTVDEYPYRMDKSALREHFAKYGVRSGVNPGIMWMSDAELAELSVEEIELTENLLESTRIAGDRRKERRDEQTKIRHDYERKLKTYDKQVAAFNADLDVERQRKLREEQDDAVQLREARVKVGYIADADDPRVRDILGKKEPEKTKKIGWKKKTQ